MERGRLVLPLGILAAIGAGLTVWLARDGGGGAGTVQPVTEAAGDARAREVVLAMPTAGTGRVDFIVRRRDENLHQR